jgi:hypothetical protein
VHCPGSIGVTVAVRTLPSLSPPMSAAAVTVGSDISPMSAEMSSVDDEGAVGDSEHAASRMRLARSDDRGRIDIPLLKADPFILVRRTRSGNTSLKIV